MFSSILSIIAGVFQTLGWMKQKSDQDTGAQVQRGADNEVALKVAENVQVSDVKSDAGGVPSIRAGLLDEARP